MSLELLTGDIWFRIVDLNTGLTFNDFVALALTCKSMYKVVREGIRWEVIYLKWKIVRVPHEAHARGPDTRLLTWKVMVNQARHGNCAVCWKPAAESRAPSVPRAWLRYVNSAQARCLDCFLAACERRGINDPLMSTCNRIVPSVEYTACHGRPSVGAPFVLDVHQLVNTPGLHQGMHVMRYLRLEVEDYYRAWVEHTLGVMKQASGPFAHMLAVQVIAHLKTTRIGGGGGGGDHQGNGPRTSPEELQKRIRWMSPFIYAQTQSTHHDEDVMMDLSP